jgi:hypothetical protein
MPPRGPHPHFPPPYPHPHPHPALLAAEEEIGRLKSELSSKESALLSAKRSLARERQRVDSTVQSLQAAQSRERDLVVKGTALRRRVRALCEQLQALKVREREDGRSLLHSHTRPPVHCNAVRHASPHSAVAHPLSPRHHSLFTRQFFLLPPSLPSSYPPLPFALRPPPSPSGWGGCGRRLGRVPARWR